MVLPVVASIPDALELFEKPPETIKSTMLPQNRSFTRIEGVSEVWMIMVECEKFGVEQRYICGFS